MAFIRINKSNFYHNLNQIALKIGSIDKIAMVLKDNAYGHGILLMGKLASEFGIKHAVVRKRDEALLIDGLFESILILGDSIKNDKKYSYTINTLSDITNAQQGAKVELKVDTGMHRNGIAMEKIDKALAMIAKQKLNLIGLMTHYRSADELSSELFWQQKNFEMVKSKIKEAGFGNLRIHSYNSATSLRCKSFDESLVRVGIGAYGYNELPTPFDEVALRPVLSLYAQKIASRVVQKGERIGYGGDFRANKQMVVSTYDLGYGDGWCRGNNTRPYITSEGLAILGRVSMDFITLASDNVQVCIMDDAQKSAKQFDTICYEMTTALSKDIERMVV